MNLVWWRTGMGVVVLCQMLWAAWPAHAQTSDNVLVVVNENSPASIEIGQYYTAARSIPADHVVRIKTAPVETIQRGAFETQIETPIGAHLTQKALQDRVLYIVLTKGVPIRVAGSGGRDGTGSSVDSELTLLYRKLLHQPVSALGRLPNPYYLGTAPLEKAEPMTRFTSEIYLVTRLDGFSVDDVKRLVDRGITPSSAGRIVLDQKATLVDRGGDQWLQDAADRLLAGPGKDRVTIDTTRTSATSSDPLIGYYSWGSNDPANARRQTGLTFSPGAIAATFVSTDARTFMEPPADWKPSGPGGGRLFAGSFQSLTGDLIRDGITGIAGHVGEPFLDATIRPQILFPAYLAGFNLAESFYLAMPFLSWQTIVVGDPLCTPFPRKSLAPDAIAKGFDPESQMPAILTERRMALAGAALNPSALKQMLAVEVDIARGAEERLESSLARATELEPRLAGAHLLLAAYYGKRGDYDRAIARFRRVVEISPNNATALNDLAYMLAENKKQPAEALPFAERALRIAPAPPILDTLGWTYHLLGQDDRGIGYLERALTEAADNVDILLHAAIVHAALNYRITARAELASALKLDPTLAERADVKALQATLK